MMQIDVQDIDEVYPLTAIQKGMLVHAVRDPEAATDVVHRWYRLEGDLNMEAFQAAWQTMFERHDVFRTAFSWTTEDEPRQVVLDSVKLPFGSFDWTHLSSDEQHRRFAELRDRDRSRGFNLREAPLMRMAVIQTEPSQALFFWSYHHILLDGWSVGRLFQEVGHAYASWCRGRSPALPPPVPFRTFVDWLQDQDEEQAKEFWGELLSGVSSTRLVDNLGSKSADATTGKSSPPDAAMQAVDLSDETIRSVQALAQDLNLTLSTVYQSLWAVLLDRYRGVRAEGQGKTVTFGCVLSGRPASLPGSDAIVGPMINTIPVPTHVDSTLPLDQWLKRQQPRQARMRQFGYVPLYSIRQQSDTIQGSRFDTLFLFQNHARPQLQRAGGGSAEDAHSGAEDLAQPLRIVERGGRGQTGYPLAVSVQPDGSEIRVTFDRHRLSEASVRRLLRHYVNLLRSAAQTPSLPVGALSMLDEDEHRRLTREWSDGPVPRRTSSLIEQFDEQVEQHRDRIACTDAVNGSFSYEELFDASHRVAAALRRGSNEKAGSTAAVVAISMRRTATMLATLLGVWRAGAAYLPLDPSFPEDRLRLMLDDAGAEVICVDEKTERGAILQDAGPCSAYVLNVDRLLSSAQDAPNVKEQSAHDAKPPHPDALAYLTYTSGSTGRPKGVEISHAAVQNFLHAMTQSPGLNEQERLLAVTTLSFDISVLELFGPLLAGGCIVLASSDDAANALRLRRRIAQHDITTMQATPATWRMLTMAADEETGDDEGSDRKNWPSRVFSGGEALSATLANRLLGTSASVHNLYGPTEATVWATQTHVKSVAKGRETISIGTPIHGVQAYILDHDFRPVPPGVAGELFLSGRQLARGYRNQPRATAEAFVPNPFAYSGREGDAGFGSRLYRTGDRVRWSENGAIDFLGRMDRQVKIRGHRIEPGEIEAHLSTLDGVGEAAVVAFDEHLVGYVAAAPPLSNLPTEKQGLEQSSDERTQGEEIKRQLADILPPYSVPDQIVVLGSLPHTPNGKVDRAALPDQDIRRPRAAHTPPQDDVQTVLCGIWTYVLDVEDLGIHDSFFQRGGHSLTALQVITRVKSTFEVEIPLRALFDHPTVAGFTEVLRAEAPDAARIDTMAGTLLRIQSLSPEERKTLLDRKREVSESRASDNL